MWKWQVSYGVFRNSLYLVALQIIQLLCVTAYSQADESSWEMLVMIFFQKALSYQQSMWNPCSIHTPARKELLWQGTRWVNFMSWKKKNHIRLKLLLLTIVLRFITFCIIVRDICPDISCAEPLCSSFQLGISKHPMTLRKSILSTSCMKILLMLFISQVRGKFCGFLHSKLLKTPNKRQQIYIPL